MQQYMIIRITAEEVFALHLKQETTPQLVLLNASTEFVNYNIVNMEDDLDYGDVVTVVELKEIESDKSKLFGKLGGSNLAVKVLMERKMELSFENMLVVAITKSRRFTSNITLANPASGDALTIASAEAPHLFRANIKVGSCVQAVMNILPKKTRADVPNQIYLHPGLETDILWPLSTPSQAPCFYKSLKLLPENEHPVLELKSDQPHEWENTFKALKSAATAVKLTEKREIMESKLDQMEIKLQQVGNLVEITCRREINSQLAWQKLCPKYAKDTVLVLSAFMERMARIRTRIVAIMHEPGIIAFRVLSDMGTLLQATNVECLEAISTTGWRAMTIPQMAHYLGDLRALYGVAENNNSDEEPSRLILQAYLGANVGSIENGGIYEVPELPDFITMDQKEVIKTSLDNKVHTVVVHSPSGSGKSTTLKYVLYSLVKTQPGRVILITATNNLTVRHLLAETIKELEPLGKTALFLHSTYAFKQATTQEYKTCAPFTFRNRLIELSKRDIPEVELAIIQQAIQYLEESSQELKDNEEEEVFNELSSKERDDSQNILDQALQILMKWMPVTVFAATVSMATRFADILKDGVDTVLADEAGQIREIDALLLISKLKKLTKTVVVGDYKQIGSYEGSIPAAAIPLGFGSMLKHIAKATGPGVKQLDLKTTFRFNPYLAELISELCYEKTLVTPITIQQRDMMYRLCDKMTPAIFVNVKGQEQACYPSSRTNLVQSECAVALAKMIKQKVPECDLGILTFYEGQRAQIEEILQDPTVECANIDSFQGREKDICIIVTTVTNFPSSFVCLQQRIVVALSRSKHGFFIIGHADTLRRSVEWTKVTNKLEEIGNMITFNSLQTGD